MKFDEFLQEAALLEGLEWRKYRRPPARRAVEERIAELSLNGFAEYLNLLRHDRHELATLADRMHITVTRFFRDRVSWRLLADAVLPDLCDSPPPGAKLTAWSAGCCGGEEPYSLAMLWLDQARGEERHQRMEILASDIDGPSLARARCACYDKASLKEVPPSVLERFFTKEGGRWCVKAPVQALVHFNRRNIMTDPLPSKCDLVLCRYLVFTYYRGERLGRAASRLWNALRPGGILMIGAKEDLQPPALDFFTPVEGHPSFFRRR